MCYLTPVRLVEAGIAPNTEGNMNKNCLEEMGAAKRKKPSKKMARTSASEATQPAAQPVVQQPEPLHQIPLEQVNFDAMAGTSRLGACTPILFSLNPRVRPVLPKLWLNSP
ncbi:unnamed protein product, partial [Cuscuta europaea]